MPTPGEAPLSIDPTTAPLSIDPTTVCTTCDKPWSEHWGFNCDEPYNNRKFRPLLPGHYPNNRAAWHVDSDKEGDT